VKPAVKWFARLFFVIATPVFFLTLAAVVLVNVTPLYSAGFKRFHVDTATNISEEQLKEIAKEIRYYFNNSEKYLQITVSDKHGHEFELFDENEQMHMADVKNLVRLGYGTTVILGLSLIGLIAVGFGRRLPEVSIWLKLGGAATMASVGIVAVLAATNFESLFDFFHQVFFKTGTWIFDQPGQYLAVLFPQAFWMEMSFLAGVLATIGGAATFFVGFRCSFRTPQNVKDDGVKRGRFIV
jgi:integral membrane protein (TIGR01906 family)